MARRQARRKTELDAEKGSAFPKWLVWRIKHYGDALLTVREAQAMTFEVLELRSQRFEVYDAHNQITLVEQGGIQQKVARRMGITQGRVSQLLDHAEVVMRYYADRDVEAFWFQYGRYWHLEAPIYGLERLPKKTRTRK